MSYPVQISAKAKDEFLKHVEGEAEFIRLSVVPGGCAGMTYSASIDSNRTDHDVLVFESGGLKVLADERSQPHLVGVQIDYSDDVMNAGFRIVNPTAKSTCGCGSSFCA